MKIAKIKIKMIKHIKDKVNKGYNRKVRVFSNKRSRRKDKVDKNGVLD